jgi:hypothetical protein
MPESEEGLEAADVPPNDPEEPDTIAPADDLDSWASMTPKKAVRKIRKIK